MGQIRSGINLKRYSTASVRSPSSGPDLINRESIVTPGSWSNVHPPESRRGIQAKSRPHAPIRRRTGFLPKIEHSATPSSQPIRGGGALPTDDQARRSVVPGTNLHTDWCYTYRGTWRTRSKGYYHGWSFGCRRPRRGADLRRNICSDEQLEAVRSPIAPLEARPRIPMFWRTPPITSRGASASVPRFFPRGGPRLPRPLSASACRCSLELVLCASRLWSMGGVAGLRAL
jgi:hypothetical protein